ncbi:hypothetical protein N7467_007500 [Penicillium canescens]|nr:hypothetical protein N7467_007500 [Penicillium canescens]
MHRASVAQQQNPRLGILQPYITSLCSKSEGAEYEECAVTLTLTARLSEYSICQSMGAYGEHVPPYSTVGAEIGIKGACDWSRSRDAGF